MDFGETYFVVTVLVYAVGGYWIVISRASWAKIDEGGCDVVMLAVAAVVVGLY